MAALERRSNLLAAWVHVSAAQCPDRVLVAAIGQQVGWPPGREPSDAELGAIIAWNGNMGGTA